LPTIAAPSYQGNAGRNVHSSWCDGMKKKKETEDTVILATLEKEKKSLGGRKRR